MRSPSDRRSPAALRLSSTLACLDPHPIQILGYDMEVAPCADETADADFVGGVVPLCLAKVKTPALMKLKMLVDHGHEVHQQWELEVDEQGKGEMRSVFQGPAVSTGGANSAGEIENPEPDAASLQRIRPTPEKTKLVSATTSSSIGGGGGTGAFGSGPRVPYTPEIKGYNPEYTRPVFYNFFHNDLWAFSIEQESTIQPLRHTAAPAACLMWSANIISIKVLHSSVGYPVNLYGSVYVRDDLDCKRVYLFRRDRDNSQLVKSLEETLVLTGPSRGLVITDNLFFEIDLKMRCDQEVDDMKFSQGSMQYSHVANESWLLDHRSCLLADELATEMSTVEMMYAPVQRAVEASIRIKALGSPHREGVLSLYGKVTAFITETPEEIVLFDSEASGAVMNIRDDGSFELWRSVISVPIDGSLTLRVETWEGDSKVNLSRCSMIFIPQICDENVAPCTFHPMRIKVAWSPLYIPNFDDLKITV